MKSRRFSQNETVFQVRGQVGDDFVRAYVATQNGGNDQGLEDLLERYAIQWTIFDPDVAVVRQLDHLPDWQRVYTDKFAVVHRRIAPAGPKPLETGGKTPAENR